MEEKKIKEQTAESVVDVELKDDAIACEDCNDKSIPSAAPATMSKAEKVKEIFSREITNYTIIYSYEYIDALAYAKECLAADYGAFKMKLKNKVPMLDLERAIKNHPIKYKKEQSLKEQLLLDGIDLGSAIIPQGYIISIENGIKRCTNNSNGTSEVPVCFNPVLISMRLVNADNGKERLEISFLNDGEWKKIYGTKGQFYNKSSIVDFCEDGLPVTSNTAGELVSFLFDYEATNKNAIPKRQSISRLGWINDNEFFPYATVNEIIFEKDSVSASVYHNLTFKGDYAKWKETIRQVRKNPIARFFVSASFTSPLLEKIGMRTFVIHIWYHSGSGKSAGLKGAISVWGNPLRIMGNGFTTVVGTEQLAGTLKHLPLGIDEKQSADEKKIPMEHLVYILGQGSGKIRGNRGGGNAELTTWRNIIMLTGEEPVTKNSSLDGVQTRTLELYGKPIDDARFAKELHTFFENNYGHAGEEFMREICKRLIADKDFLQREYKRIVAKFKADGIESVHGDYIAAITLGDILAETIVFGTDMATAESEAYENGKVIYYNNLTQLSGDTTERAYDFVKGWLLENDGRFAQNATPCFGKKQESKGGRHIEYFVFSKCLHEALEAANFNVTKSAQGFLEKGYLIPEIDSDGNKRSAKTAWVYGKSVRCYVFPLPKDLPPEQINFTNKHGELIPADQEDL